MQGNIQYSTFQIIATLIEDFYENPILIVVAPSLKLQTQLKLDGIKTQSPSIMTMNKSETDLAVNTRDSKCEITLKTMQGKQKYFA